MIDKIDFYNIQYTNEDDEVEAFKKYDITIHKNNELDTFNDLNDLNEFIKTCDFVLLSVIVMHICQHPLAKQHIYCFQILKVSFGTGKMMKMVKMFGIHLS